MLKDNGNNIPSDDEHVEDGYTPSTGIPNLPEDIVGESTRANVRDSFSPGYIFNDQSVLTLDVDGFTAPLVLHIRDEMIIGRHDTVTDYHPDVDLTSYGGYRLGLSRRHAKLKREANRLIVVDLGSRNGTAVNGEKILSDASQVLKDGDRLTLANLTMRVIFQQSS